MVEEEEGYIGWGKGEVGQRGSLWRDQLQTRALNPYTLDTGAGSLSMVGPRAVFIVGYCVVLLASTPSVPVASLPKAPWGQIQPW